MKPGEATRYIDGRRFTDVTYAEVIKLIEGAGSLAQKFGYRGQVAGINADWHCQGTGI
jgi:hypothetical protein